MNKIRQVNLSDIPALQELYQHTVLTVNRKDYTAEEVADWASWGDDTSHWNELFEEQHYVVAENEEGVIVGFGSVNDDGYMHTLFVHKDFQHQGVATSLYKHLEAYARESRQNHFLKNKVFRSMKSKSGKLIKCVSPIIRWASSSVNHI